MEAVIILRNQVMSTFANKIENSVDAITSQPLRKVDENEFTHASRLVCDGVREIRKCVLLNRNLEELDSETKLEYEDNAYETSSCKIM